MAKRPRLTQDEIKAILASYKVDPRNAVGMAMIQAAGKPATGNHSVRA